MSNFIPPQLFKRFSTLSHLSFKARKENPDLKTQIRLGDKDLIFLMNMKGDGDWTSKDIHCLGTLPDIETYKNWPTKPMPEIVSPDKGRIHTDHSL